MKSPLRVVVLWQVAFALCLAATSFAQTVPAKGELHALEVATWNIEWFGSPSNGPSDDPRQFDNAVRVLRDSNIDVWAVQEIANASAFNTLIAELSPRYTGALARTSMSRGLGLAYIYKPSVLLNVSVREILTDANSQTQFAGRPPFLLEAQVITPQDTIGLTFINMHMKATSDIESYNKRLAASQLLQSYIEGSGLDQVPLIILGDLNDLLSGSITAGRSSPYSNFVQATNDYDATTLDLQLTRRYTWCGNSSSCSSGSTIDHIIISNELASMYRAGSVDHYDELLSTVPSYVSSTSDHLPVFTIFDEISSPVGIEEISPETPSIEMTAYPNPFHDWLEIAIDALPGETIDIRIFDIIGRVVVEQRGDDSARLSTRDLTAGVYVVEATVGSRHKVRRLVVRQ